MTSIPMSTELCIIRQRIKYCFDQLTLHLITGLSKSTKMTSEEKVAKKILSSFMKPNRVCKDIKLHRLGNQKTSNRKTQLSQSYFSEWWKPFVSKPEYYIACQVKGFTHNHIEKILSCSWKVLRISYSSKAFVYAKTLREDKNCVDWEGNLGVLLAHCFTL